MHPSRARQTHRTRRPLIRGAPESGVRVWMLGGFALWMGTRIIEDGAWRLRKAANLVKLLALSPGHRLHREQIMDVLWPDLGRRAASNNLRVVVHAARRTLDLDPNAASDYLTLQGEQLALCPECQLWVDVEAFEDRKSTRLNSSHANI